MNRTTRVALAFLLFAGAGAACSPTATPAPPGTVAAASSAPSSPAATPSPSASQRPPAVTLAEAGKVVRGILGADDVVRASGDESFALAQTRDAQAQIIAVAFQSTGREPPRYTWGTPTLLVPRLDRPPYWFAAVAERKDESGRSRTAMLVFMKQYEVSLWQLSFASLLYPGTPPPAVSLDPEGYATALPTKDDTVAISPHLMAPLHATIAEEGPGGFAAELIAAGPQTTGYFTEVEKIQPDFKRRGFLYDSLFAATAFPIYALRTTDGGAAIMYSLTRTTLWQAKIKATEGLVPVPEDVRWDVGSLTVPYMLRVVDTQQYVSHVSRKGSPEPARIIAFDDAPTGVSSR
ncbi:hypothetical protein [Sphaerisporangium corydalis]|uniref:DUF8094 domain-containing protein n=1 Tax=Sphaerisporangium corydalis TaxID=1441875 RepID=A0ABV9EA85_9ACTN|nr:hypothetical protein [Sphaerisporangium corydalis]